MGNHHIRHRMRRLHRATGTLLANESGATAVEYTLIGVMLALTVFGSMQLLQEPMTVMFGQISTAFASAR